MTPCSCHRLNLLPRICSNWRSTNSNNRRLVPPSAAEALVTTPDPTTSVDSSEHLCLAHVVRGTRSSTTGTSHPSSQITRGIFIGVTAAAIAAGGVAYYVTSSRTHGEAEREPLLRKKKDKKKRSLAGLKDQYGPILERRKQKGAEVEGDGCVSHSALSAPSRSYPPFEHQIKVLSKRGQLVPSNPLLDGHVDSGGQGNNVHQARSFVKPKQYYTCAIEVPPHLEPVFYSHRTACYVVLEPPQHEDVVAGLRQGAQLEGYEGLFTTLPTTILSKFQNDVRAVLAHYPTLPENPSTGDGTLILVETLMVPRLISRGLQLLPSLTQSRVKLASEGLPEDDL
ncbi:hypothetical protein EDB84DRAFT_1571233 [Lactarius hengduanensis]|nr:hypothetical protein EDB84DRAFT_1571233 [Lactarius hengduanensis]